MEYNKKVLIGAPISNRELYLPHYLKCIYELDYPKELIHIYWLVNNSTDNSKEILKQFKKEHEKEYASITIYEENSSIKFKDVRETEVRQRYTYQWLARCRNHVKSIVSKKNCDYFLSIDSDIMVKPDLLKGLMKFNKNVVCSLIFNGYEVTNEYWKFPNVLKKDSHGMYKHIVNVYTSNPSNCPKDKLLECDFSGAVFLASRKACEDSKYDFGLFGEDQLWSESLVNKGYIIYYSPYYYSQHLMSEKWLKKWLSGENLGR